MKTVILAGGLGSRISEESHLRPKPMIEIGGKPILWHIMKIYSAQGFHDFVICCGYKGYSIKEYFLNYYMLNSDVTFDYRNDNTVEIHSQISEPWRVTVLDTGLETMTGGRLKRAASHIGNEAFMLTYGDGVADISLSKLLEHHRASKKLATLTAVPFEQRFGILGLEEDGRVSEFREKSELDGGLINGGYMVMEPGVLDYIEGDTVSLEQTTLETLSRNGELTAYRHDGFWQCMDTQRDRDKLEKIWEEGSPPWKMW